jgi:hypothetical protein
MALIYHCRRSRAALRLLTILLWVGGLAIGGCTGEVSEDPGHEPSPYGVRPAHTGVPLLEGSEWIYDRQTEFHTTLFGESTLVEVYPGQMVRTIVGNEIICGQSYVLERRRIEIDAYPDIQVNWWARYRQDRNGLYQADVPLSDPPGSLECSALAWRMNGHGPESAKHRLDARARWEVIKTAIGLGLGPTVNLTSSVGMVSDTGDAPGQDIPEIQRLAYPLRPGAEWILRTWPFLVRSRVVGREHLEFGKRKIQGYRIQLEAPEVFDAKDTVFLFYGRCGYLGLHAHLEDPFTVFGDTLGTIVYEEREILVEMNLSDPAQCDVAQ